MGQIRNTQIINNDLTGCSINRNFKFFDECEVPINIGEIRFWQGKWWKVIQNITTAETGGSIPNEGNLTYSPDLEPDYWFNIPNYGKQKYIFESFIMMSPGSVTPTSMDNLCLMPMASRMVSNFNSYTNFLFDVYDESGHRYEGKQFDSQTEFLTWYNSLTLSGTITVEVYGIIDGSRTNLHKVYGRNGGLSVIVGKNAQGQSNYHNGGCLEDSDWEERTDFATDIIERITGTTPIGNARATVHWSNSNNNKYFLYESLNSDITIHFTGGLSSTKMAYDPVSRNMVSINNNDIFYPISGANGFYSINMTSAMWNFEGVQNLENDSDYFNGIKSFVKVYGFRRDDGAILAIIKPVGQDEFRLNYYGDQTDIDMFAGYYNKDNKMCVRRMGPFHYKYKDSVNSNISYWMNKNSILAGLKSDTSYRISKGSLNNIVYFYVDKNGEMCPFTHEIKWILRSPGAKAYTLLDNSNRY